MAFILMAFFSDPIFPRGLATKTRFDLRLQINPEGHRALSLLLCKFARKKENPSPERFIASPFELCIASILLPAEALSTLKSFSAERPVIRGRGHSHALKLLIRS